MDLGDWLRSLGLGKYEAAFRENEIDKSVLLRLSAEDLKELGVTALGHRVKLLDAIAALRSDVPDKPPSVDTAVLPVAVANRHAAKQHLVRRQLEVITDGVVEPRPGFLRASVEAVAARKEGESVVVD